MSDDGDGNPERFSMEPFFSPLEIIILCKSLDTHHPNVATVILKLLSYSYTCWLH